MRSLAAALDFLGFSFIPIDAQNRPVFGQKKSKVMKAAASDRTPKSRVRQIPTGKFLEVVAGASVAQKMNIEYRARSDEG